MASKDRRADELHQQLVEWNDVFSPRPHWSAPGPFESKERLDVLELLVACQRCGAVERRTQIIKTHRLDPYTDRGPTSADERRLWRVAGNRRGADDLKDETWSAYQHLRKLYPRSKIEPHYDCLPYGYLQRRHGVVVTAGNIEPSAMLQFMVDHNTPRLGIVGEEMKGVEEMGRWYFHSTGNLCMSWVEFAADGFQALRQFFAARDHAIQEAMAHVLSSGRDCE